MNVSLDETGRNEPTLQIQCLAVRRQRRFDGNDATIDDPDIDSTTGMLRQTCIS
jgi:hypothetical protein